jgi:streptogramin lyase
MKTLSLIALLTVSCALPAAADALLSGTISSAAGEKMGGVAVAAKADGTTITTSVYTDETGSYYFPPLPPGKYRVWAQALSFETAKGEVEISANKRADFTLKPMTDFDRQWRQLPGDAMMAALPEESDADRKLKRVVRNNCTGCHSPSYIFQHKFDEAGWNAIIEAMKRFNVSGVYMPDRPVNAILDHYQKDLAAYLARFHGPNSTTRIKLPPRPTGEAARVVFKQYDVMREPQGVPAPIANTDGGDWSLGTPSKLATLIHDAWADLDGVLWFTSNTPNAAVSIGRIDPKTGALKMLRRNGPGGLAANAHGMTRDAKGILWFDLNVGPRGLGRIDPKTEQFDVYVPPKGMSPTGGAVSIDYDGLGNIWASSPDGALRFDPANERFTEFKSLTYKTPNGTGVTYGAAADRDGNGWWAEMTLDIIGKGDSETGKTVEIKLPPVQAELDRLSAEEKAFYAGVNQLDFNMPFPWAQGPRRMGTDKAADVLWLGLSWGGSLGRIDTRTNALSFVPLPDPFLHQPYHVAVDSQHNAWTNLWTTDKLGKYDPSTGRWTLYDIPVRGTEVRFISLREHDGTIDVVLPLYRNSQVAVMTLRSEADLQRLKEQAGR